MFVNIFPETGNQSLLAPPAGGLLRSGAVFSKGSELLWMVKQSDSLVAGGRTWLLELR